MLRLRLFGSHESSCICIDRIRQQLLNIARINRVQKAPYGIFNARVVNGIEGQHSSYNLNSEQKPADKDESTRADYMHQFARYVMQLLPRYIEMANLYKDELTLYVTPEALVPVMTFLRDHSHAHFKSLMVML
jgi:NADH dehydrogenase (ubiquinone) Fe-S protein 3